MGRGWWVALMVNRYCSASQWLRVLKRPRLGVKNPIIDSSLLNVASNPQTMTKNEDVNPKKIFCVFNDFL